MSLLIARVSSGCGLTHITTALRQSVFAAVRMTERQHRRTLYTLIYFWLAMILQAREDPQIISEGDRVR